MDEINNQYRELCTTLGDVEVKIKGLLAIKDDLFSKLVQLDMQAAKIKKDANEA